MPCAIRCAEKGYSCPECRTPDTQPAHLVPTSPTSTSTDHHHLHHHHHHTHLAATSTAALSSTSGAGPPQHLQQHPCSSSYHQPGSAAANYMHAAAVGLAGGADSPVRSDSPSDAMPRVRQYIQSFILSLCYQYTQDRSCRGSGS